MSTVFMVLVAVSPLCTTATPVPYVGDETSLIRLKATPEEYAGKVLSITGAVAVDDYFNYWYRDKQRIFFSMQFVETSANLEDSLAGNDSATLYLPKQDGSEVVDRLIKVEEESKARGGGSLSLVNIKAVLNPIAYRRGKQWDLLEVRDIRFYEVATGTWGKWYLQEKREERAKAERAILEAELAKREAETRAMQLKERQQKEQEEAERLAKLPQIRDWQSISSGEVITGKYRGVLNGNVRIELADGSTRSVPVSDVGPADRAYIEGRKRK